MQLREVAPPESAPPQEIITVGYVGICGSDTPKLLQPTTFSLPQPWRPGHEIVGLDSHGHWAAVDPLVPCGACADCASGRTHLCARLKRLGWDLPGGFAEKVQVPTGNIHRLPATLDPAIAVLADAAAVALHGVRCCPIKPFGRVAIIGAGVIGLLTALVCAEAGLDVTLIHRAGNPPPDPLLAAIPVRISPADKITNGAFDTVIDAATGYDDSALLIAIRAVRNGGSITIQNAYHPGIRLSADMREVFGRSLSLSGSYSHCRNGPASDFCTALTLLSDVGRRLNPLINIVGDLADLRPHLSQGGNARRILKLPRP